MTTITLPPLPDWDCPPGFEPAFPEDYLGYTRAQLRARDLEVARLVLEGAAQALRNKQYMNAVDYVRALGVKHHE
jgi:hypothetical protein